MLLPNDYLYSPVCRGHTACRELPRDWKRNSKIYGRNANELARRLKPRTSFHASLLGRDQ